MLPLLLLAAAGFAVQGEAELVQPDVVSTPKSEIRIAVSPDGRRRLWGTIGWEGGAGGWDIWETQREGAGWSKPQPVPFNGPDKDFDPFVAADGVYFFSNRPGGQGGDDLWFAPYDSAARTYGTAVNLGPRVNSRGDEWAPTLSADGQRLLFASDGHGGKGLHDLFVATRAKDGWSAPVPLPGEANSADDDFDAAWLHDGRTLVFTRKPAGQDESALYVSEEKGGRYAAPRRLGPEVNVDGSWNLGPAIDPREPGWLFFSAARPGNGRGYADVYRIRYR